VSDLGPATKHTADAIFFWDPRGLELTPSPMHGFKRRCIATAHRRLWFRMSGDHPSRGMWEFVGVVRIPGQGERVAIYQACGYHPQDARGGEPALENAGFRGARRKGAQAALDGADKTLGNPYQDERTHRGGVTFSRAWGRYWDEGWEAGKAIFAVFVGERIGITRAPGESFEDYRTRIEAEFPGAVPSDASATLAASPTKE
jgi:hypothetical protein